MISVENNRMSILDADALPGQLTVGGSDQEEGEHENPQD